MIKTFTTFVAVAALFAASALFGFSSEAQAGCYKTGPNTVQCTR